MHPVEPTVPTFNLPPDRDPAGNDTPTAEGLIARFEEAWARGQQPSITAYLPQEAGARLPVLVELVHADLEFRLKSGEPARVESYLERYPELVQDRARVLDLIRAEYQLRKRCEPEVSAA